MKSIWSWLRGSSRRRRAHPGPQHTLGVVAVFKNEGHILKEWVEHYINEGVEHFYLIDNGSTDSSKEILKPYVEAGLVDVFSDARLHRQIQHMNQYVLPLANRCQWLLVVDLDEFLYARGQYTTIAQYAATLDRESVAEVLIPWKIFGSSGHDEQPESVIQGFQRRWSYEVEPPTTLFKALVNTSFLRRFDVHWSKLYDGGRIALPFEGAPEVDVTWDLGSPVVPIDEKLLEEMKLHLNHYLVQSWSFFRTVKMTRGDAMGNPKVRDRKFFDDYDKNDAIDDELASKQYPPRD